MAKKDKIDDKVLLDKIIKLQLDVFGIYCHIFKLGNKLIDLAEDVRNEKKKLS